MAQITIYGKPLTKAEVEAVKALVAEAAGSDSEILVVNAISASASSDLHSAVVVLGTPVTCSDPNLEANLVHAHKAGQRVVWVWPLASEQIEVPEAAAKYSYSYVPWDAHKLASVLADDDVAYFETAGGESVPKVPTERNLCVEDDEGSKAKKAKDK